MKIIITEAGAWECRDGTRADVEYVGEFHAMGYAGPESYHGTQSCMCWNVGSSLQTEGETALDIIGKWDKRCKICDRVLEERGDPLSGNQEGECWGCRKDRRGHEGNTD